jgi:uncharacterized metal-binding protein
VSSGQKHAGVTKGIAAGIGVGAAASHFLQPVELTFMAIGCLLGLFLSPDADVDSGHIGFHYVRKVFGRGGLWVWQQWWMPYQISIKHRSFWSHAPIVGTVVRLLYLPFPVIILALRDQKSTPIPVVVYRTVVAQLIAIPFAALIGAAIYLLWYQFPNFDFHIMAMSLFVGLCISDVGHWILDM